VKRLREDVQSLLLREGKPVAVRELVKRLRLEGEARKALKTVLRQLIADGEIVNVRGARVGLPDRRNLVVGRLSCSPSGYGFVIPEKRGDKDKDVYVSAVNMKEALQGDRVVVRVERVSPKGPEGRIIRVLDRALTRIVGRYEQDGRFGGHVVPFDKRVLYELFIPAGEDAGAASGEMVAAEITRPPSATRNPAGRVLEVLGRLDEKGVDLKVVMAKYALPDAFPEDVEEEARRVPPSVTDADREGRTDFRPWVTITVDPETARDHDDAISLDRMGNGNWLLAVHIADVAHYVRQGSRIDEEAYLRGTSVYFPDRVVPMLPHELSSGVCSLVDGVDRLTQSVVMEVDGKGKVVRAEYHDGVIRSAARMSYQEAQGIVDGDTAARAKYPSQVDLVLRMDELAKVMRKRRYARGSLDFDLPEPKLVLDAAGEVTGVVAHPRLDSMKVIEEFMLAANETVAEKLSTSGMGALYRIHERPDPEKVEEFCDLVASLGYRMPGDLEAVRPEDFQRVLRQIEGKPEERLVSYLLLRTMKLARYHEENLGHFGLAAEMYAHFTSPIRRYPDLVVHRALRAQRRGEPAGEDALQKLSEMGLYLSDRERKADEAERELREWKKVRFMADKIGEVFSGYITGVQSFGLFVELEEYFVQGLVHVSTMTDDYYAFNEKAHTLKGENGKKVYRLGDRVEIQVARVDLERRQIDFVLRDVVKKAAGGARKETRSRAAEPRSRRPVRSARPPQARGSRGGSRRRR
jgi:ribonuclease R